MIIPLKIDFCGCRLPKLEQNTQNTFMAWWGFLQTYVVMRNYLVSFINYMTRILGVTSISFMHSYWQSTAAFALPRPPRGGALSHRYVTKWAGSKTRCYSSYWLAYNDSDVGLGSVQKWYHSSIGGGLAPRVIIEWYKGWGFDEEWYHSKFSRFL